MLPSDANDDAVQEVLLLACEKKAEDIYTFAYACLKFAVLKMRDKYRSDARIDNKYANNPNDKVRIYDRAAGQDAGLKKAKDARWPNGKVDLGAKTCIHCGAQYTAKGDSPTQRFAFKKSTFCSPACASRSRVKNK